MNDVLTMNELTTFGLVRLNEVF